ncbi:hypothetical protein OQA88_9159 [Cercophora sp. LCS_1]
MNAFPTIEAGSSAPEPGRSDHIEPNQPAEDSRPYNENPNTVPSAVDPMPFLSSSSVLDIGNFPSATVDQLREVIAIYRQNNTYLAEALQKLKDDRRNLDNELFNQKMVIRDLGHQLDDNCAECREVRAEFFNALAGMKKTVRDTSGDSFLKPAARVVTIVGVVALAFVLNTALANLCSMVSSENDSAYFKENLWPLSLLLAFVFMHL